MSLSFQVIFPNLILILAYILMIFEKLPRVVIALLGTSLLLITRIISQEEAIHFIDFNVIALLVGMMILVNIIRETGGMRWLALFTAKKVNGSGAKLMIYLSILTAVLSAMLDNVTTVLIVGSVTISLIKDLKLNPIPYLISESIASNVGGTATLIGDPPNIMVGSAAKLTFGDFIYHLTPVIILIMPFTLLTLYLMYKKDLKISKEAQKELHEIPLSGIITHKKLLQKSVLIFSIVILAFCFHGMLHLEAGTIAICGASVLLIFENKKHIWDDVEWMTIFFFIGLFIIVGAVEKVGTISYLSELIVHACKGSFETTAMVILWMSAFLSALIDNIPYTATMIPLIKEMGKHYTDLNPLWWALSLGACLGGNGTLIGATANIVIADMASKAGKPISFMEFFKVGIIVMLQSILISSVYIWVRYLN